MSVQLIFEKTGDALTGALLVNGALYACRTQKTDAAVRAEQIYLAKADRNMKGMDASFVRLRDGVNGFLPYAEMLPGAPRPPRSGQPLLVQVKKPPVQQKCAYVTMDISLAGRYLILLPFGHGCSASARITDEDTRRQLLCAGGKLCPEGCGLVIRSEAVGVKETVLSAECTDLEARWHALQEKMRGAAAPCLLSEGDSLPERMLRDLHGVPDEVVTDCPALLPPMPCPVRTQAHPLSAAGVPGKLEKSLRRRIWLPGGGNLAVDPCEAMTVIDVNSARDTGKKDGLENAALRLNLEACEEIARIMQLRQLGGIILIDFVDMTVPAHRQAVADQLAKCLSFDPVKTVLHGFTSLGLMEVTRKKTEQPLPGAAEISCPYCHGTGILEKENDHEQ